ncbi:hypothetical protein [Endozoicomonas arenosclerae]|uniref:hypothetical protein n=1 Tax=Endozoicomonas arenosclerae TaxID=1633495 RepID=UPI0007836F66|nr:hypothetical protein [Endozoicomonas arenosclerae]
MFRVSYLLLLFFLVSGAASGHHNSHSDGDCAQADANCDDRTDYHDHYWLKLKRLFDLDMGEWGGEQLVSGSTVAAQDGRLFCIISYSVPRWQYNPARTLYDYQVQITGPQLAGQFVLQPQGQGGAGLPVKLTLKGVQGDATANVNFSNWTAFNTVQGLDEYEVCRKNELSILAEVTKADILQNARAGQYQSQFTVTAQSNNLTVSKSFLVTLQVKPSIMISGLNDVELNFDGVNNVQSMDQSYCVFNLGGEAFELMGESTHGQGVFALKNGNSFIEYGIETIPVNSGNNNWTDLVESTYVSGNNWAGAFSQDCQGSAGNMKFRINIPAQNMSSKPSGIYRDTVQLTVIPL